MNKETKFKCQKCGRPAKHSRMEQDYDINWIDGKPYGGNPKGKPRQILLCGHHSPFRGIDRKTKLAIDKLKD